MRSLTNVLLAASFSVAILLPAQAQTADGTSVTAAPPAPPGTPPAVTRTAPGAKRGGKAPVVGKVDGLPKPTKQDLADQRRLEHDMRICIGC